MPTPLAVSNLVPASEGVFINLSDSVGCKVPTQVETHIPDSILTGLLEKVIS